MKIDKVTITGWDNSVDASVLVKLQKQFPFVEWGILFSRNKEGQLRYPTKKDIEGIVGVGLNLSAHFCGDYAKNVLELSYFDEIRKLHNDFKRVQLNYNFSRNEKWSIPRLWDFSILNPGRKLILQFNKSNSTAIKMAKSFLEDIHILYDASGGRGTEIKQIPSPFKNYTGYAGGISPVNIHQVCRAIKNHESADSVWIDMESGVRSPENVFDISMVKIVLTACSEYINV